MTTADAILGIEEQIQLNIKTAEEQLNAAQKKCEASRLAAKRARAEEARAPLQVLDGLAKKFQERAKELAIASGSCPRRPMGATIEPSDITVDADGLTLSRDINDDDPPKYFVATWQALLSDESTAE